MGVSFLCRESKFLGRISFVCKVNYTSLPGNVALPRDLSIFARNLCTSSPIFVFGTVVFCVDSRRKCVFTSICSILGVRNVFCARVYREPLGVVHPQTPYDVSFG